MNVSVEMVDATDKARLTTAHEIAPGDTGHVDVGLRLNDLEPGPYRVRVTATAGAQTTQREIGVTVR